MIRQNKNHMNVEENMQTQEMECCVVCGITTDVPVDTPIENRKTYMECVGQLCPDCCWELYHTTDLRTRADV